MHDEILRKRNHYFWQVIFAYAGYAEANELVACNLDHTAYTKKRTYAVIEYQSDVLSATEHALKNDKRLLRYWQLLIEETAGFETEKIPADIRLRIANACSRIYWQRALAPREYWSCAYRQIVAERQHRQSEHEQEQARERIRQRAKERKEFEQLRTEADRITEQIMQEECMREQSEALQEGQQHGNG